MRTNRNRWKGNRKRGARIETQAEGRVGPRQRQPSRPLNLLWGRVRPTRFGASFASFRDDGCKLSETMGASCRMLQQCPQRQQCPRYLPNQKFTVKSQVMSYSDSKVVTRISNSERNYIEVCRTIFRLQKIQKRMKICRGKNEF